MTKRYERKHVGAQFSNWTPAEVMLLEQRLAEHVIIKLIAHELGRSESSLRAKIHTLRAEQRLSVDYQYAVDADPFIAWICDELKERRLDIKTFLDATGVAYRTFWDWRNRPVKRPKAHEVARMLGYLGYQIKIVPIEGTDNGPDHENRRVRPIAITRFDRRRP